MDDGFLCLQSGDVHHASTYGARDDAHGWVIFLPGTPRRHVGKRFRFGGLAPSLFVDSIILVGNLNFR